MGDLSRLSVRLDASAGGPIALTFHFDGEGEVALFEPLVPMELRVTAGGAPVTVVQPPLDIGVRRRVVPLPAVVPTPVRLVFEGPEPVDERFVWTLRHPPSAVELVAVLEIEGELLETPPVTVSP